MVLHLVRHGHRPDGFRGGWSEHGLSLKGRGQAEALARRLSEENWSIDSLVSSDLPRAAETAAAIGQALDLPVRMSALWRPIHNGGLAGLSHVEADARFPGLCFRSLRWDESFPAGESPHQFYDRISTAFDALCRQPHFSRRVIVVTHGEVIRMMYALLLGKRWSNRVRGGVVALASIHSFRSRGGGTWLQFRCNDTRHLRLTEPAPSAWAGLPGFPPVGDEG